jgi:hypothetical protein
MRKKSREKRERREGYRIVQMTPDLKSALEEQKRQFREKFGRDPTSEDPVFFDPASDTPQPLSGEAMDEISRVISQAMGDAGIDPALIYATQKTGRIAPPSEQAYDAMSPEDKAEWHAALDEYDTLTDKANNRKQ